ncbi:MAG TPA: hypothetical protein PLV59_01520 [Candidatus Dojkabacteria bacterium]|nr:hypothetical protein [Candidatus Dojkabacteria bacterium]
MQNYSSSENPPNLEILAKGSLVISTQEISVRSGRFVPVGSWGVVTDIHEEEGDSVYSVTFYKKANRVLRGDLIHMYILGEYLRPAGLLEIEGLDMEQYRTLISIMAQFD